MSNPILPQSGKRAAIYIRVSTEAQAEKASPEAQKADCMALCENKGYTIAEVYADIGKYRVGKRMVEPSGTRTDRPQFQRMIADGHAGKFDVILAWREDRLYRTLRPMLEVSDLLDDTKITIELVKETFDQSLMWLKAGMARMELQARHDRLAMGVAGRLAKGIAWTNTVPYGYGRTKDGQYVVNPEEAQWVQAIFRWYGENVTIHEIRRRLIDAGAKQRKENNRRAWPPKTFYDYLKASYYWTGIYPIKWDGTTYETPIPVLISEEEIQRVQDRQARYKKYPAGNAKHNCLAAGLVYCGACNIACTVVTIGNGYTRKGDGPLKGTVARYVRYICSAWATRIHDEGCVKRVGTIKVEKEVWAQVYAYFTEPNRFLASVESLIAKREAETDDAEKDVKSLEKELAELEEERQSVITLARKGRISEDDLTIQLFGLDMGKRERRQQLLEKRALTGSQAERLRAQAQYIQETLSLGLEELNETPTTAEEAKEIQEKKRAFVQAVVERVELRRGEAPKVTLKFDMGEIVSINPPGLYSERIDTIQFSVSITL